MIIMTMISPALLAQDMVADVSNSTLNWHGKKVTGEHFGTINLKEGWMSLENDRIAKGKFVIDMASLTNTDLKDQAYNAKLVNHLKSDDFFGVEKHPVAVLEIKKSSAFKNNEASVEALLTIKGITHPISFTAKRNSGTYHAEIIVDRSKYDVRYGSGSFFEGLGDKMIYDDFTLNVSLKMNEIDPEDS